MRRNVLSRNRLLICFAFGFALALGFIGFQKMLKTSAVHSAYNGFDAGNIISDFVMSDYNSMSEASIQSFLKSKNSCNDTNIVRATWYPNLSYHIENGHFVCMADERFNGESAAHIIWQAAQDYHINPKVLIVLLEKEQGLVTDTWPNSTLQYRSATGYGCPDTAACDSQYYGFKNQVRNAAELFRYILDHGSKYYPVGNNYIKYNPDGNCGSSLVYIRNRATSALYQYTPYQPNTAVLNANPGTVVSCGAYGNSNFYRLFTSWFGSTQELPSLQKVLSTNRVANEKSDLEIKYHTHIENYGWLDWVDGGVMSGTAGYSFRTEAFALELENNKGIEYRAHVANIGWLDYVKDGAIAGTTGQSLQMEAVQIRLTGEIAKMYDVYYRAHVADIGWMDWVKNDTIAGTTGQSKRIEALQVKLVRKNLNTGIEYRAHVANIGWMDWSKNGVTAGTTGQSRQVEAVAIKLPSNLVNSGNIRYKVHAADIGWMDPVKNGAIAGTTGQSRRIEAITIELTDSLAKKYDIYYRTHVANIGWMGWVKNGAIAGTTGKSLRIEALEIQLVAK